MDIYDKHYNKWFMSKSNNPVKNGKKEEKPYKLKLRMLNKNAVNEYCDVGLCGSSTYDKKDICPIIQDSFILSVVGKLRTL